MSYRNGFHSGGLDWDECGPSLPNQTSPSVEPDILER